VRWDANAYGSIVWALLFLHTTHVITDLADTIVLTVFSFTHPRWTPTTSPTWPTTASTGTSW
jgi:hypothetical protein